jgi:bifunctional DNA-binding transcriptional regulator/antitoxin component of YhaV-PrlF toxin-antitoxin module
MKVTSKGQVTIPIALLRKYGITPDVEQEFEETDRGPRIVAP